MKGAVTPCKKFVIKTPPAVVLLRPTSSGKLMLRKLNFNEFQAAFSCIKPNSITHEKLSTYEYR